MEKLYTKRCSIQISICSQGEFGKKQGSCSDSTHFIHASIFRDKYMRNFITCRLVTYQTIIYHDELEIPKSYALTWLVQDSDKEREKVKFDEDLWWSLFCIHCNLTYICIYFCLISSSTNALDSSPTDWSSSRIHSDTVSVDTFSLHPLNIIFFMENNPRNEIFFTGNVPQKLIPHLSTTGHVKMGTWFMTVGNTGRPTMWELHNIKPIWSSPSMISNPKTLAHINVSPKILVARLKDKSSYTVNLHLLTI